MAQLESLANLGEIIGAFAVVVSLVYLAMQVRQNTHAQQTENFSRALERQAALQGVLSQDAETTLVFSRGLADPSALTPRERVQFTWLMYELFGALEFMFLSARANSIPDEVWERWAAAVAWYLTFPGAQTWWGCKPTPFTRSFAAYVESLLEDNPTDAATTRRYQQFLAQGR